MITDIGIITANCITYCKVNECVWAVPSIILESKNSNLTWSILTFTLSLGCLCDITV